MTATSFLPSHFVRACALLACLVAPAQAGVLVVDVAHPPPAAGVDFAQIADAVAAAAEGDILLVKPGTYLPFTVDGKSLAIFGSGLPKADGRITIQHLVAGQRVVLRGLASTGKSMEPGLHIDGCAGVVWIEECQPRGGSAMVYSPGPEGLLVSNSLAVTLVRDTISGGVVAGGAFIAPGGSDGMRMHYCDVAAWDLSVTGPNGSYSDHHSGSAGNGVIVGPGGHLRVMGGSFKGGSAFGGAEHCSGGSGCHCDSAGSVGTGLITTTAAPCSVELLDVLVTAGSANPHPDSYCPASDVRAIDDLSHQVTMLAGAARRLLLPAQAVEGETVSMTIDGQPGDAALVFIGFEPSYAQLPFGTFVLLPSLVAVLGPLPTGDATLPKLVPDLGPGVEGMLLVAQPYFQPAGGGQLLGAPSAMVLLDAPF